MTAPPIAPTAEAIATAASNTSAPKKKGRRFRFIDEFRGLVGILMLLGHSSYYFNAEWLHLDPLDPFFASFGQFMLRYIGYLCAPGFLMMNGAMVWYSYTRRRATGHSDLSSRWHLIQRGLFLVLVQMTWVNSSWGGFSSFKPGHLGIIATIGLAMVFLTLIVHTRWQIRLAVALGLWAVHPLLLGIPYDHDNTWATVVMQTFIDSGKFTKYPLIPWLGLAIMGSVMATAWIDHWHSTRKRLLWSALIAVAALAAATAIRMGGGYGNLFPFERLWHYSFFLDQKYPPSIYHALWFFGEVVAGMTIIIGLGRLWPKLTAWLGVVGRVPLFFYCVHIGILGIFSKRLGLYYREGGVQETLIGLGLMMIIMMPLAYWFGGVKRRSKNYLIRMI